MSANFTPPAFMRPPVSTWDLMTVGAPISCAMRRASSGVVAKPCGDIGMPALATIFRDSYSKNLMGGGSLSWAAMRLAISCFLVLFFLPAGATAADLRARPTDRGRGPVRDPARALGHARGRARRRCPASPCSLQGRAYPYKGEFKTLATATTRADGTFALQAPLRPQHWTCAPSRPPRWRRPTTCGAYVYPRPRSTFTALSGSRLRITQFLRTAPNVRLTARTTFYLGPKNAKTAKAFARAKPRKIGKGRFRRPRP